MSVPVDPESGWLVSVPGFWHSKSVQQRSHLERTRQDTPSTCPQHQSPWQPAVGQRSVL